MNFGKEQLLNHLAVIPDGNRRWARGKGLLPWEGHREGMKRFREIKEACLRLKIPYFTFWAASADNLTKRSKVEVRFLISILRNELKNELKNRQFEKDQVRIRVLGDWKKIINDRKIEDFICALEKESAKFKEKNTTILLAYDGKTEMLEAIKKLRRDSSSEKLDYEKVKNRLWTKDLPPVDLVIRTGGEPHWSSGFMMWHTADSQFYFDPRFWPDFGEKALNAALHDYKKRERRLGA